MTIATRQESDIVLRVVPLPNVATLVSQETRPWRRALPSTIFAVLVAVGAALRLIGITHQCLWLDEAFSVYLAAHRFPAILEFVAGSDAHPPLYYLLLHLWLVFGSSTLSLRALSAAVSIAALFPMYVLGRRLASPPVALLATGLMALSAFQAWYAQEVRMYAVTMLAVLIAIYGLVRAWQGGGAGSWTLFALSMLAALYLDYSAFYAFSALLLWFFWIGSRNPEKRKPFVLSSIAIILGYLPWLPMLWRQLFALGNLTNWIGGANGSGVVGAVTDLFFTRTILLQPGHDRGAIIAGTLSLTAVIAALWLPRRVPAYPLLTCLFGCPCVLGLAMDFLNRPTMIARQIMVVQPALFLLLALAAEQAWNSRVRSTPFHARSLLVIVFISVYVVANISAQVTSWTTTLKEDWRGAASLVATHERPDDLILFNTYFAQMPFDYYFRAPGISRISVLERGYQVEESLLFANMALTGSGMASGPQMSGFTQVWLVISHTGTPDEAAVPPWLATHFHLAGTWHFVGVTVLLYQAPTNLAQIAARYPSVGRHNDI